MPPSISLAKPRVQVDFDVAVHAGAVVDVAGPRADVEAVRSGPVDAALERRILGTEADASEVVVADRRDRAGKLSLGGCGRPQQDDRCQALTQFHGAPLGCEKATYIMRPVGTLYQIRHDYRGSAGRRARHGAECRNRAIKKTPDAGRNSRVRAPPLARQGSNHAPIWHAAGRVRRRPRARRSRRTCGPARGLPRVRGTRPASRSNRPDRRSRTGRGRPRSARGPR